MNNENEIILIGQGDDLELDNVEHFEHDDYHYAIYHLSSGFYATQGNCTCDENAFLSEGNINNEEIECVSCGKIFSIISGDPINDPDSACLRVFDITTENDDLFLNL